MLFLIFVAIALIIFAIFCISIAPPKSREEMSPEELTEYETARAKKIRKFWIAVGACLLFLILTRPSTLDEYGHELDTHYYKVDNYIIISTLSTSYGGQWNVFRQRYEGGKWRVVGYGIAGITWRTNEY